MLQFLNIFFLVFHTLWMAFNCLGWIWKKTRLWHLATITLTALSWFGMGYWYEWGYCICTDWHWQVRKRLGYPDDHSYTHLLILAVTGLDLSPERADMITGGIFALVIVLTIALNARDFVRWRRSVAHDAKKG
jgi:Protein of Unknown function (DUF2784)